tara:strand:+ start:23009 stop:28054 length:5046 start_codon:yes stop_codon:yes gene_type:complete
MPIGQQQFTREEIDEASKLKNKINRLHGQYQEGYFHDQHRRNQEGWLSQLGASTMRGGLKLVENTVNLPTDLAGFPKLIEPTKLIEQREGWGNHLIENVVDYAGAYVGVGKLKWFSKVKPATVAGGQRATTKDLLKSAAKQGLARGAAADFIAFDGSESLVMSLLDLHPDLHSAYDEITSIEGWQNMSLEELNRETFKQGWDADRLAANWGGRMFNAAEGAMIQSFLSVFWQAAKLKYVNDKSTEAAGAGVDKKIQEGVDKTAADGATKSTKHFIDPDEDLTFKQRQEKAAWEHGEQVRPDQGTEALKKQSDEAEAELEKLKTDLKEKGEAAKNKPAEEAPELDSLAPKNLDKATELEAGAALLKNADGLSDEMFDLTKGIHDSGRIADDAKITRGNFAPAGFDEVDPSKINNFYGTPQAPKISPVAIFKDDTGAMHVSVDKQRLKQIWDFFRESDQITMNWDSMGRVLSAPNMKRMPFEFADGTFALKNLAEGSKTSLRRYNKDLFSSFDDFTAFVFARGEAQIRFPKFKGRVESVAHHQGRLDKAAANKMRRQGLGNFWKYEWNPNPKRGEKQWVVDEDTFLKSLFNNIKEGKKLVQDLADLKAGKAKDLNEIFLKASKILNVDAAMTDTHLKYATSRLIHFFQSQLREAFQTTVQHPRHEQLASAIQWLGEGTSRKTARDWIMNDLLNHIDNLAMANKLSPQGVIERLRKGRGDWGLLHPEIKVKGSDILESLKMDEKVATEMYIRTWAYRLNQAAMMRQFDEVIDRVVKAGDDAGDRTFAELAVIIERLETQLGSFRNLATAHGRNLQAMRNLGEATGMKQTDEAAILAEIVNRGGGKAGMKKLAERLAAIRKAHGDDVETVATLTRSNLHRSVTGIDVHNEYWLNSILSGLTTQIVNGVGTVLHIALKPVEGVLGTIGKGGDKTARQEFVAQGVYAANMMLDTVKFLGAMARHRAAYAVGATSEQSYLFGRGERLQPNRALQNPETQLSHTAEFDRNTFIREGEVPKSRIAGEGIGLRRETNMAAPIYAAAKKAFHSGKSVIESRSELFDVTPHQAITGDLLPEHFSQTAKDSLDWLGNVIRIPSRLMITTDEVFKQIQYRSAALAELTTEAMKVLPKENHTVDGMTDYIAARFQGLIRKNGARYTPDNIKDEAMTNFYRAVRDSERSALDGRQKPLPEEMKNRDDYVASYFAKNYDPQRKALSDYAMDWAEDSTFTRGLNTDMKELIDKGYFKQGDQTIGQDVQDFVGKHSAARVVAPFIRTPINLVSFPMRRVWLPDPIMQKMVDNPDGWFSKMHLKYKADMLSGDPRRQAMAYGRLRTGGMMYASMTMLAATGTVTGGGPKDPSKRNQWLAAGARPYSVKVGDKYISYARLDPFATVLGLAADYTYMTKEAMRTGEYNENAWYTIASSFIFALGDNIASKTYLQGLSDFLSVLTDPSKGGAFERWMTRHTKSYVPKAASQFTHLTGDGSMRKPRTFMEAMKSQIPFAANSVDPLRNLLGQPIKYTDDGVFWRGLNVVNPFLIKTTSKNNVLETLAGMDYAFSLPSHQLGGRKELDLRTFRNKEGRTAWDWFQERVGTIRDKEGYTLEDRLESLFSAPYFLELTKQANEEQWRGSGPDANDLRVTLTKIILQEYRAAARAELPVEFPEINKVRESLALRQHNKVERLKAKLNLN